jgi:hypothetical protein
MVLTSEKAPNLSSIATCLPHERSGRQGYGKYNPNDPDGFTIGKCLNPI